MGKNLKGNCQVGKCFQDLYLPVITTCSLQTPPPRTQTTSNICSQYALNSSPLQFKVFPSSIPPFPTFPNLWKTPIALGVRDTLEGRFPLLHLSFLPPKQEGVEDVDSCIPIPPPPHLPRLHSPPSARF